MQDILKSSTIDSHENENTKLLLRFIKEKGLNIVSELEFLKKERSEYDYFDATRTWSYTRYDGMDMESSNNDYHYFWWKIQVEWTLLYLKVHFNESALDYYDGLIKGYETINIESQDIIEFREKHRLIYKQLEDEHGVDAEAFGEIP